MATLTGEPVIISPMLCHMPVGLSLTPKVIFGHFVQRDRIPDCRFPELAGFVGVLVTGAE